jgi:hypothetical protein
MKLNESGRKGRKGEERKDQRAKKREKVIYYKEKITT